MDEVRLLELKQEFMATVSKNNLAAQSVQRIKEVFSRQVRPLRGEKGLYLEVAVQYHFDHRVQRKIGCKKMTAISPVVSCFAALLVLTANGAHATAVSEPVDSAKAQITVLYDAFGEGSAMQKDWGYAALVEYGGKRILFDTGNNPDVLAQNAKAKGIDLSKLDVVVMSHRHGDHMGGLVYVLNANPEVTIYAPKESFGVYGADLPSSFYRKDPSLAPEQRY